MTGSGSERGSVSLFAVSVLALLLLLGAALGVVASMVVRHRTAQAAADLAALAGATQGRCSAAARIAAANGADLTSCVSTGDEVTVEVVVAGPGWLGQVGDLEARARAGPAHDDDR